MKKINLLVGFLIIIITLSACDNNDTDVKKDVVDEDKNNSWKLEYDMEKTSNDFLENVSVCYQIFPISWADSNDDGYGDINGITENLSYLADTLGVDCIWINPVNVSPSYHKYDVVDYYGIDPQFGTVEDYENLIKVAHDSGIRVLMDFVINHTAYSNPWFEDARIGEDSSYRDYYIWNDLKNRESYPSKEGWTKFSDSYYYSQFWSQMPELNFDNQDVRKEIEDIAEFWLLKGIDGFRIDAAMHLYDINEYPDGTDTMRENINYFREFNSFIKSINEDAFMVGEIAINSARYTDNFYEGMDSTFNFGFADSLIYSINAGYDSNTILDLIETRAMYEDIRVDFIDSIFLSNHDQDRFLDRIGYNLDKAKLGARINLTLPGISWVYYGEEIGMTGVGDHKNIRQPFKWSENSLYNTKGKSDGISSWDSKNSSINGVSEQLLDDDSILNVYKEMINLKKSHDVLKFGDIKMINNNDDRLMTYTRSYDGETYLIINNMSMLSRTINSNVNDYEIIYQSDEFIYDDLDITFSPLSTVILKVNTKDITFTK